MDIGDRVVWLGALREDGSPKGGWAGNGRARISGYEQARPFFHGASKGTDKSPPTGPAVRLTLDMGRTSNDKALSVWVEPRSTEIVPDEAPLVDEAKVSAASFLREPTEP